MIDRAREGSPPSAGGAHPWWDAHDHAPRPELFGLSPAQTCALVHGDWNGSGPLSLRDDVPLDLLRLSPLFADVHALVAAIGARGTVPATSAGYLDPAFVDTLLGELTWPGEEAEEVRQSIPEIVHENEFRPLQALRAHTHALELIELSGGVFRLTPLGSDVVRPERAGLLYQRLVTYILGRRGWDNVMTATFDAQTNGVMELPRIAPFVLWGLGRIPVEWRPAFQCTGLLMPPWTREQFAEQMGETFLRHIVKLAVFDLFERLGLAEQREYSVVEDLPFDPERENADVRRTALYDHVLHWEFDPPAGGGVRGKE